MRLVQETLDLTADEKLGKRIAKAFVTKASRDDIVALLRDRIDTDRVPAWIQWSIGGDLDSVGHLGEPMFRAKIADEDEFYSDPGAQQLVVEKDGRGTKVTPDGETSSVKLAP